MHIRSCTTAHARQTVDEERDGAVIDGGVIDGGVILQRNGAVLMEKLYHIQIIESDINMSVQIVVTMMIVQLYVHDVLNNIRIIIYYIFIFLQF